MLGDMHILAVSHHKDSKVKVKVTSSGQKLPRSESTTTVCGVNYQLLAVICLE